MAVLVQWPRQRSVQGVCLDISAHNLELGIDPRAMILHFFGLRWAGRRSEWPFHQRIVIDRISVDGREYRAGKIR